MGVCGSKPSGTVRVQGKARLPRRGRRRGRRVKKAHSSRNVHRVEPSNGKDASYTNPAFQGNAESWFDPDAAIESDGDDEFYSMRDDLSQTGSLSNVVTPRFVNINSIDSLPSFNEPETEPKNPSLWDKTLARTTDKTHWKDEGGTLSNCGFNSLMSCLDCEECIEPKRKSAVLGASTPRKRSFPTVSFKGNEIHENPSLSKRITQRPFAGSQIVCSPLEKKIPESWSRVEPNIFKVRGQHYVRDKRKECASSCSAYIPIGADVFLSPCKINHIARFIELPQVPSHGELPPLLVINLQIPLYPAALFQNEYDGPGMSMVFYFKLSENYPDLPLHFQENFKKMVANDTERIKSFPMDANLPFRERLKILARVINSEDLQLTAAERKLLQAYNEKPVLTRPQHEFYTAEKYFEIDLDIHRFSYIARKGLESFHNRIKHCIFDFGLTIQGNKAEELPECMLCCIRMKEVDYTKYSQLCL